MLFSRTTCTINDIKRTAHIRRERVEQAVATGALRPVMQNPAAKGRTPKMLFAAADAAAWMAAGCPVGGAA